MAGVNKVILVGYLGRDPELRHLEGGLMVARFSLATTEVHKDKNGNRIEHTEWHNIVLWRILAENAEKLLKKGSQIYLEGKLQTRDWQDKDGNKRQTTEIVGETFQLLGKRDNTNPGMQNPSGNEPSTGFTGMSGGTNDLPF
jgi:single-strand DNA-binding protein